METFFDLSINRTKSIFRD